MSRDSTKSVGQVHTSAAKFARAYSRASSARRTSFSEISGKIRGWCLEVAVSHEDRGRLSSRFVADVVNHHLHRTRVTKEHGDKRTASYRETFDMLSPKGIVEIAVRRMPRMEIVPELAAAGTIARRNPTQISVWDVIPVYAGPFTVSKVQRLAINRSSRFPLTPSSSPYAGFRSSGNTL